MSYRLEIGFALLLGLALVVALWAANRKPAAPDFDFRNSTFLTGPSGSKGLHDVLTRLGRLSERRRTSLVTLATERAHRPAILALLDPRYSLEDDEVEQVVRYVRAGGAVVATGDGGGITRCAGWRIQPDGGPDSIDVRSPDANVRLPRSARVLTRFRMDTTARNALEELVKSRDEDKVGICSALVPFEIDTVVAAVNTRPAILRLRYRGGGTMTLAADPGWFTNRMWRDTDVPIIALPLLTPRVERPGRVAWDEYHQGFGEEEGSSLGVRTLGWLRTSPAGWAILQLVAIGLVWLAMNAVRFGPARSVIERRRRSPLEHLEALGAGLESAGGTDTAVQRLALGLRRRLSRAGHVANGNVGPWLEGLELAMRGAKGRAAVRRLHQLVTARDRQSAAGSDPARVLHAAQAVEDVWEELRPRTTRNA
jgi:uncharacterized protein DUF4350